MHWRAVVTSIPSGFIVKQRALGPCSWNCCEPIGKFDTKGAINLPLGCLQNHFAGQSWQVLSSFGEIPIFSETPSANKKSMDCWTISQKKPMFLSSENFHDLFVGISSHVWFSKGTNVLLSRITLLHPYDGPVTYNHIYIHT